MPKSKRKDDSLRSAAEKLIGTGKAKLASPEATDTESILHELTVHQIELAPNPVMEVDLGGNILYLNSAAKTEFNPRTPISSNPWAADFKSLVDAFRKNPRPVRREIQVGESWYQQMLHYVEKMGRIRFYWLDITNRKLIEEALRESEEKYRRIVETSNEGIVISDFTGMVTYVNQRLADMSGYRAEEIIGRSVFDFTDEKGREVVAERIAQREQGRAEDSYELEFRRKDGSPLWVLVVGAVLKDEDGKPVANLSMLTDITDRKRIELLLANDLAALTRLHDLSTSILESGGTEHVLQEIMDAAVEIAAAQKGTLQLWEGDSLRMVAHHGHKRPFLDFFARAENRASVCGEALKEGKRVVVEDVESSPLFAGTQSLAVLRRAGVRAVQSTPMHNRSGQMIGILTTQWDHPYRPGERDLWRIDLLARQAADFIEQMRTNEELRASRDELELRVQERTAELEKAYETLQLETQERVRLEAQLRRAQKMEALGTLSGGIAHDFNNVLAAVVGFAELVADHVEKGSKAEQCIRRVVEAGLRGRDLVRQLLAFSRRTEKEKKPLEVASILKETVKLLKATTPAFISIKTRIASDPGLILGDPTQIQQVLMNLCTNAVYAMREKGGLLDVRLSHVDVPPTDGSPDGMEPGPYVKIVVHDTGTGMPPDIIDKIFDPFFTTKTVGEGTGLGLSVVHGIVTQSDGYIFVESEPGKGSTFTVYFPQISGEVKIEEPESAEIPNGSERILFVDDEEALVLVGERILAELGYSVTSRTKSREALSLVSEDPSRFDLVITDVSMPEMTGVEFAREVLSLRPDMPIIMSTGFSHLVNADAAKAAGMKAFVMKPLTKREIAKTVRQVLDG